MVIVWTEKKNIQIRISSPISSDYPFHAGWLMLSFRGGEEILKYDGVTLNAGRGLNPTTGIFLAPQVH